MDGRPEEPGISANVGGRPLQMLLFAGAGALGVYLFFGEFLPALEERRLIIESLRSVEEENRALETESRRLRLRAEALRGNDPRTVEQGLREIGIFPEDRIQVLPPPGTRKPPDRIEDGVHLRAGR